MPTPRRGFAAVALNGKIYAFGGFAGETAQSGVPSGGIAVNSLEIYDPTTDTWSGGPPLIVARGGLAGAGVNGFVYAVGGTAAGGPVERLTPGTTLYLFTKN
jgi:N-acetylneuraminic acid mutarotase